MSLMAPGWLLLCGFMLLVLALHRRRPRTHHVASIRLWRLVDGGALGRPTFKPPRPDIQMVLQLLAVALIALALARPLIGAGERYAHEVVVLDASGSMRMRDVSPDRFGAALGELAAVTARAGETGARLTVILAAADPRIVAARLENPDGLGGRLAGLRAGDGEADWAGAARLAAGVVKDGEPTRIVLISDRPGRAVNGLASVRGAAIEWRHVGGPSARNAGLLATLRALPGDGHAFRAEGTVAFSPGFSGVARVSAFLEPEGGNGWQEAGALDVRPPDGAAAGAPAQVPFALNVDVRAGGGAVVLRLADDDGPQDNTVQFVVRAPPRPLKVLMLGEAPGPLKGALRAAADVELVSAAAPPPDVAAFDLVVVNGIELAVRPATNVLWIGAGHANGEALEPVPPGQDSGAFNADVWQDEHPLSRSVEWRALRPRQAYRSAPLPGAATLVEARGLSLVQARSARSGREVRLAFDLGGTDWTDLPGFPVFVSNLLHWIAPDLGRAVDAPCIVGAVCTADPRLASGRVSVAAPPPAGGAEAAPAGAFPVIAAGRGGEGREGAFVPDRAGLYWFTCGGLTGYRAVNRPAPADADPADATPADAAPAGSARPAPAWRWLLAAAMAILAAEAAVSGRGSERFLHAASLAAGNPLARRRRTALGLRALVLALLALAVLRVPLFAPDRHQNVVVVAGPAISGEDGALLARVDAAAATSSAAAATRLGAVSVGASARIVRDLAGAGGAAPGAVSPPPAVAANLEAGLAMAAAMLPEGEPGRVVVAFDGNETRGDAALALPPLFDRNLAVDVLPDTHLYPGEALVEDVVAPKGVHAGDSFPLSAVIYTQGRARGTVRVLKDGEVLAERPFEAAGGRSRVETVIPAAPAGRARFEVAVDAAGDRFAQNNRGGVAVDVAPPPQVLIVAAQPAWGEVFASALRVHGIASRVAEPRRAPYYLKDWLAYQAIVLMNVPAIDLTTRQQELIEKAVAEHGRGLLMLGGENSFGPGGYFETPLERVSPLSSRVPREAPRVALVFVLDRSGSMQRDEGGATRLDIAKQATAAAARLLHPDSTIAIVVFDSEAKVLLPVARAGDEAAIARALAGLEPGGGTAVYPGLVEALHQFEGLDAAAKHIVVMSDGLTQPGDFPGIIKAIAAEGISVSAVAIGESADPAQLREIARLGRGAFHATQDFRALPGILSQEALLLSGQPVEEREAAPLWAGRNAEFFVGLPDRLPDVRGYVLTTPKPRADIHLVVEDAKGERVPLLASWRYGNGRVVALSSHGAGPWASDWQVMAQYPLLWSQTLRHVISSNAEGLLPHVTRHGDIVDMDVAATDAEGAPRPGLVVTASLSPPGPAASLALSEVSPGGYHGRLALERSGDMVLRFAAGGTAVETPFTASYPALYRFTAADPERLAALAHATGGRILPAEGGIFAEGSWRWVRYAAWPAWAVAAFVLFMCDLITRYAPGALRFARVRVRGARRDVVE